MPLIFFYIKKILNSCFFLALFFTATTLFFNNQAVFAQNKANKSKKNPKKTSPINAKVRKLYEKSQEKIDYKQYPAALSLLQKAVKKSPKFFDAHAQIAEIYLKQNDLPNAEKSYLTILKADSSKQNKQKVFFTLGKMFYDQQQYPTAIQYLQKCLKTDTTFALKTKTTHQLKLAQFAQHALKNPVPFHPILLDSTINSSLHDEYLPALTADEQILVFTRRLKSNIAPTEDFYISQLKIDTIRPANNDSLPPIIKNYWKQAIDMGSPINTSKDEGAICISPDGKRLFFAARDRKGSFGNFDIYYCIKKGNDWEGPYNIGAPINTPAWESQPSISADGKQLYFCSKRKGGIGGVDIWVSTLKNNNYWSEPQNLGTAINTPADDQSPYIHPDGHTLYFSSNGHIGMGEADLYVARMDSAGNFNNPQNLGYPINTTKTENGLTVTASGEKAYYSSFNTTNNTLDLYYFELPKSLKPQYVTYIKGSVYEQNNLDKKLSANIELIDLETGKTVLQTVSDALTGAFLVTLPTNKNYLYNVSKNGYLFFSENFSLKNIASAEKPYIINIPLTPIQTTNKNNETTFNIGQTVVLKNVFFESDSYQLQPTSYLELNKLAELLQNNPFLRIEIGGHTDNTGKKEYNLELSKNRAKAVFDYLIQQKDIDNKRLMYKGYADLYPLQPNSTPEGRAINRRTEFKILEK